MTAQNRHLDGRKFFMHPAHTTIGVSASLAAMGAQQHDDVFAAEQEEGKLRVCLISGAPLERSDQSLAALQGYLEEHYPVRCSQAFSSAIDGLSWLDALDGCDCVVIHARRLTIAGEPLRRIQRYCRRGGPIVALRAAGQAFQDWPDFERVILGADFDGHFGDEPTEIQIVATAKGHPVLRGVGPFTSRSGLCKNVELADNATVLLDGTVGDHSYPVAWVRSHRGGRVFCTSLGHADDFNAVGYLRLLANALAWTTRTAAR